MNTTAVLSYVRLPAANAPNTIRFFYRYTIDCSSAGLVNDLAIADLEAPSTIEWDLNFEKDSVANITGVIDPCVILPSPPCRTTFYYHADAPLPDNAFGYLAATINCCRPYDLANVAMTYSTNISFYQSIGIGCGICAACVGPIENTIASYIKVPPLSTINSSIQLSPHDTLLTVCQNRVFSYRLQATDPDGDSIAWHFSAPRTASSYEFNKNYYLQKTLPFSVDSLYPQFSMAAPAGPGLSLDPVTGVLSGSIADTGDFDLTISALEYRNGVLLDSVMLDQYVEVYDCSILPKPNASIPALLADCNSYTVYFPNSSTPLYDKNWNNTTYQWAFGDGSSSQLMDPTHTYADTGTYQASLILFPGLYCADTAYSKVLIYPFVQASFTKDDSCVGQPVLFTNTSISTGGPINSVYWSILLDTTVIDSARAPTLNFTFSKAPQTYLVLLTVETEKGCLNTDTQYVNIWPAPLLLATHDTVLSFGATLQLQANDGNHNYRGQFAWSPPEGLSDDTIPNPVVTYDKAITYDVFIQNSYGCSLHDSIHIIYYKGPNIYLPNAFTPNGDGRNDIFRPLVVGFTTFNYFRVFNRNGQVMYETSKPGEGWDGTLNGRPAAAGTYVWEIAGIDSNKKMMIKSGTVILIR